jgi:hypothetical protein
VEGAEASGLSHSSVKHLLANARSNVGAETTARLVWILAPAAPGARGCGPDGRLATCLTRCSSTHAAHLALSRIVVALGASREVALADNTGLTLDLERVRNGAHA